MVEKNQNSYVHTSRWSVSTRSEQAPMSTIGSWQSSFEIANHFPTDWCTSSTARSSGSDNLYSHSIGWLNVEANALKRCSPLFVKITDLDANKRQLEDVNELVVSAQMRVRCTWGTCRHLLHARPALAVLVEQKGSGRHPDLKPRVIICVTSSERTNEALEIDFVRWQHPNQVDWRAGNESS